MVALNELLASFSIPFCKIEPARLTNQPTGPLELALLLALYEPRVAFADM